MDREKLTRRLLRILRTIDSGGLPAVVREVYVFGSYARGALDPADLDLVIVHDPPSQEYRDRLAAKLEAEGLSILEMIRRGDRFRSAMLGPLRRPGEKADYLLTDDLGRIVGDDTRIRRSALLLLWSQADRDYEAKVQAIAPDPTAGRFARNHLVSVKRVYDNVEVMEEVVGMVADGRLVLTRFPVAGIDTTSLTAHHADRLARWRERGAMGKKSLEVLPFGIWWMEAHGQRCRSPDQAEMYSEAGTHRVHFGRPSLEWMVGIFESSPEVRHQCLIPHLSRTEPNELLAFERGPNWGQSASEAGDG